MKYPLEIESATLGIETTIKDVDGHIMFREINSCVSEGNYRFVKYEIILSNFFSALPMLQFFNKSGEVCFVLERNRPFSLYSSWHNIFVNGKLKFKIREGKPFGKVLGGLLDGTFLEYISSKAWNPAFIICDPDNMEIFTLDKKRKFLGKRYVVKKVNELSEEDEKIVLLSLFGFLIFERMYR